MGNSATQRWNVVGRSLLASVGGFLFVSAVGGCLALLLAAAGLMPLAQAVHVLTLIGFVAWCAVAMWVFSAASLGRTALKIALVTVTALGLVFFLRF
ncbi:MAG: iron transporter [Pseudomonadota bacterium]